MIMTKEKGITLIALIITIIVMLILVGVTVNVALNGGLFSTAKTAVNKTQIELDRDILLSAVVGAIGSNGEVDFSVLDKNLPEGFTGSNGTYISKSGNKFKVDKNGTITYIENGNEQGTEDEDLAVLKRYFLGENGEGKDVMSLVDFDENGKMFFIDDQDTLENERELFVDFSNRSSRNLADI